METKLELKASSVMQKLGASGVSVTDRDGFKLHSVGEIPEIGNVGSLLIADAKSMFPKGFRSKKNSYPIVTLHSSDGSKTIVADKHGETVSIQHKK